MLNSRRARRARAQRGSVLSAVLIIVAFLAILGGALMSELSSAFLVTRTQAGRVATEATLDSSVDYAIGTLEKRVVANQVPPYCSRDTPSALPPIVLNSVPATAIASGGSSPSTCRAVVPDGVNPLDGGAFPTDGIQAVINGRDVYLVADSSGHLYDYWKGQKQWTASVGGGATGQLGQSPAGTLVPVGRSVALIDDNTASLRCSMGAAEIVKSQPGIENPPAGQAANFPGYTFFGDSAGTLYAYGPVTNGTCPQMAQSANLGGAIIGGPLVFYGTPTTTNGGEGNQVTTTPVFAFAVVNGGGSSRVVEASYVEQTQDPGDSKSWTGVLSSVTLPFANAAGIASSTVTPVDRGTIRLAVTSLTGQVAMVTINVRNRQSTGWAYTLANQPPSVPLGGSFTRAPYWCHCPGGDLIGAGDQNGSLFVLDTSLNQKLRYDGPSPITTTPAPAPVTGDWYFGAADGFVYLVEPVINGVCLAGSNCVSRFGLPAGQTSSSPIVVSSAGCSDLVCLYFGTGTSTYFVQIGGVRIMDLTACQTPGSTSTACAAGSKSRLWARVEVGGSFHNVIGWTYYNSSS